MGEFVLCPVSPTYSYLLLQPVNIFYRNVQEMFKAVLELIIRIPFLTSSSSQSNLFLPI
jgi:hypothetical protein